MHMIHRLKNWCKDMQILIAPVVFGILVEYVNAAWINGPVQLIVDKKDVHVGQALNISCATDKPIPIYKIYMGSEGPILLEYSNGTETLTDNDIQITVSYINITQTVNNCSDGVFNLTCVVKESSQSWKDHVNISCSNSSTEVNSPAPTSQPHKQGLPLALIIGIVIACLFVLAVIVISIVVWRKRKWCFKNSRSPGGDHEMDVFIPNSVQSTPLKQQTLR